jgi:hypothetical protein
MLQVQNFAATLSQTNQPGNQKRIDVEIPFGLIAYGGHRSSTSNAAKVLRGTNSDLTDLRDKRLSPKATKSKLSKRDYERMSAEANKIIKAFKSEEDSDEHKSSLVLNINNTNSGLEVQTLLATHK